MYALLPNRRVVSYPASPLASLLNLSRDFDRLFEAPQAVAKGAELQPVFAPRAELREGKDAVSVSLELPGIDRKDVSITLHDGVLTVSGERRQEVEVKEGEYLRTERHYGRFERSVELPSPVDAEKVAASFKDGLLTVTLPKRADARPQQINIASN